MKHLIYILTFCIILSIPQSATCQDFNLKRKTILLREIDTTDCIEFITKEAKITVEKSDYLDNEFYKSFIDTIKSNIRPSICLTYNEKDKSICKESLNLQFVQDNAMIIPYTLAEILLTGKAKVIITSQNSRIYRIKARKRSYKETMGSEYLEFIDPKSKKEVLSLLIGFGE